jgi:hypothetical protein
MHDAESCSPAPGSCGAKVVGLHKDHPSTSSRHLPRLINCLSEHISNHRVLRSISFLGIDEVQLIVSLLEHREEPVMFPADVSFECAHIDALLAGPRLP